MAKKILVTGGAGYIGSHCVLNLLNNGYDVVIFDNLSTGHIETVETLQKSGNVEFYKGDLLNFADLDNLFEKEKIDAVIHFAAFSQVGESVNNPQKYYINNVCGTLNLLKGMLDHDVKHIVFSSTAATYGEPVYTPIDEKHPQNPINTYGQTKLMIETIMDDYDRAYNLKSVRLRYFNVVGADIQSRVGEWHNPETHLVPNILKSTFDGAQSFKIFGNDYNTPDGTCIRDYVNVEDLAEVHCLALKYLDKTNTSEVFNVGTEKGDSVKNIFDVCEKIVGKKIDVEIAGRRAGDPEVLYADSKKAQSLLGWKPQRTIEDSISSAYKWEKILTARSNKS